MGAPVQVLDRVLAGKAEPLLFVQAIALLAQLVALVADHRRRLVADLTLGEGFGNHGQRLQLLPDAEPILGGRHRHAADLADPGRGADVAADLVIAMLLCRARFRSKVTVQRVNDPAVALQVNSPTFLRGANPENRRPWLRQGGTPPPL